MQKIFALQKCFSLNNIQAYKGSLTGKMAQWRKIQYTTNLTNLPSQENIWLQSTPKTPFVHVGAPAWPLYGLQKNDYNLLYDMYFLRLGVYLLYGL